MSLDDLDVFLIITEGSKQKIFKILKEIVKLKQEKQSHERYFSFPDYLLEIIGEFKLNDMYKKNPFLKIIFKKYMEPYHQKFKEEGWI